MSVEHSNETRVMSKTNDPIRARKLLSKILSADSPRQVLELYRMDVDRLVGDITAVRNATIINSLGSWLSDVTELAERHKETNPQRHREQPIEELEQEQLALKFYKNGGGSVRDLAKVCYWYLDSGAPATGKASRVVARLERKRLLQDEFGKKIVTAAGLKLVV